MSVTELCLGALVTETPCRAHDPELWFADDPARVEQAQELCRTCPVQAACLAGALERREPWGVWGGELFERGAVVARKRPRGRPRKDDSATAAAALAALEARLSDLREEIADEVDAEIARELDGMVAALADGGEPRGDRAAAVAVPESRTESRTAPVDARGTDADAEAAA